MRIDPSFQIGSVLRDARVSEGVSQVSLARSLGVSPSCLSRVEHDDHWFDTDWVAAMPASLRVALRDVIRAALDRVVREIPVFQRGDLTDAPSEVEVP